MIIRNRSTYDNSPFYTPKYAKQEAIYGNVEDDLAKERLINHSVVKEFQFNQSKNKRITDTQLKFGSKSRDSRGTNTTIGNIKVTITDGYGIREDVPGRIGKHSNGIDIVTSNKKAVSLTDGYIESVKLQGDGSVISPTKGAAAGYYITVKNNDGTSTSYMHLNPITDKDKEDLIGKTVKRGDVLWGYDKGSGSMTGPHVKVIYHLGDNVKNHLNPMKIF